MLCPATVVTPSASKKCQSSGLSLAAPSALTLFGRGLFAAVFFGLELTGIALGQRAPDRVGGFQMFNESSQLTIHLFREVEKRGQRVRQPISDGTWRARDPNGSLRTYSWGDRVRTMPLRVLGQSVHARYGLDAQLYRLQAALEDVAAHIPEDRETKALVAEVETNRNGKPGPRMTLRADRP